MASGTPSRTNLRLRRSDGELSVGLTLATSQFEMAPGALSAGTFWRRTLRIVRKRWRYCDQCDRFRPHEPREHDGELAASLSHEITQPIAPARNYKRARRAEFLGSKAPRIWVSRESLDHVVEACRSIRTDRPNGSATKIKKAPPRKSRFDLNWLRSMKVIRIGTKCNRQMGFRSGLA